MPEACERITDEKVLERLVKACEKLWDGKFRNNVFDILEKVAGKCEGRKALARAKVGRHLVSELEKMVPTDQMRHYSRGYTLKWS